MKRCALLTTNNLDNYFVYDQLLIESLKLKGWIAEEVSWRNRDINWDVYDIVVIRSTWDYQQDVAGFLTCLQRIESSTARLENSLKIVEWNISKTYLLELHNQGVNIVPTLWFDTFDDEIISQSFAYFDTRELVIKPRVSAGADCTYRLSPESLVANKSQLSSEFSARKFMLQPFLHAVVDEGEYSLLYFSGEFSHAILKKPKSGDFRVQEEHGGQIQAIQPTDLMLSTARHCLAALPAEVLYARVDLIRYKAQFVVVEIELIEPSLYFNMDPVSAQRFADVIIERYGLN